MNRRTITIAVSLILLAGYLLPGAAWAQAKKTPIEAVLVRCTGYRPEKIWVDADGIRHVRNKRVLCYDEGDINGRDVSFIDFDDDPATGVITGHGYISFLGEILGEPASSVGHLTFDCERLEGVQICTESDVWHVSDGSLIKFTFSYVNDDSPAPYSGILLDPPGRN